MALEITPRLPLSAEVPYYEANRGIERFLTPDLEALVQIPLNKALCPTVTRMHLLSAGALEGWQQSVLHFFSQETVSEELRELMGWLRRSEDQHRSIMLSYLDPETTPLETGLALEQTAVEWQARLAMEEPDPYVRSAFEYLALEDLEHLRLFAQALAEMEGKTADLITQNQAFIEPGRPVEQQHLAPIHCLKQPYERHAVDPITRYHLHFLLALETLKLEQYHHFLARSRSRVLRQLFAGLARLEEVHASLLGSYFDPAETVLERLVAQQWSEWYAYCRLAAEEPDPRVRGMLEMISHDEEEHLRLSAQALSRYEGKDPGRFTQTRFFHQRATRPPADFLRELRQTQMGRRSVGKNWQQDGQIVITPQIHAYH
ncbi:MAG: hypothetical protein ACPLPT_00040 [Moorellales bacterium]